MVKEQRFCIFCGRPGLSWEHVWSQWTRNYLPKRPNDSHIVVYQESARNTPKIIESTRSRSRQGGVQSVKLRVVCKLHCNSGWMSRLEERVKPILIPLIRGEACVLSVENQTILANWIAMKIMVCEFGEVHSVASSQEHRTYLMENQKAPDFWNIWIGNQRGSVWRDGFYRHALTLGSIIDGKLTPPAGGLAKNTQSVTLGIGHLVIHAVSSSFQGARFELPEKISRHLRKIWPAERGFLWPTGSVFSDNDIDLMTGCMDRFSDSIPWSSSDDL